MSLAATAGDAPGESPARAAMAARYCAVRSQTETLAQPLSPEDQQVQSMEDASPTKWHLAHVSWFFETFILAPHAADYRPFHPRYGYLFNSYYEGVGPRHARPRRGMLTRPPLADVMTYRRHVDAAMADFIATAEGAVFDKLTPLMTLGLHHEQQHQELLLTDILHALASQPLHPAYRDDLAAAEGSAPKLDFIAVAGGESTLGFDGDGFCFDNETPSHRILVGDFTLANRPVTNAEVLAFIEGKGYQTPTLWLADGWAWVQAGGANLWGDEAPMYWHRRDGRWWEFTLGGFRAVDPDATATHLTYFEADAVARSMDARLPTEAEWETAARAAGFETEGANLLDAGRLQPSPSAGPAAGGFHQLAGDCWEWTASAYAPYPGFKPSPGAVGEYNGKFMVSQLVLKGGSCVTPADHVRASYRNFFYPHQGWQFTGARLARD